MTDSQWQLSLFPESGDQYRSALHVTQPPLGEVTDLLQRTDVDVANLMGLQITTEILHWVEFGRIDRQKLQLNVRVVTLKEVKHEVTLARLQTIPGNEQYPGV